MALNRTICDSKGVDVDLHRHYKKIEAKEREKIEKLLKDRKIKKVNGEVKIIKKGNDKDDEQCTNCWEAY